MRGWILGTTLQIALLVATFFWDELGTAGWHHVASLAIVLALTAASGRRMLSRRFLGIGVLVTTVLATVSGFYLLYWKEGIRVDGYQDWGVWWHVAWSWAAAVFFWQHTWINRVAFGRFFARTLRPALPAALHVGAYLVVVAAFVVSGGPIKERFTNENYIEIGLWAWITTLAVAYGSWFALRRRSRPDKVRIRGHIDVALVPAAALATLSGIPLLWLGDALDSAGLKYASKLWHVVPSILFAVLVFVHSVQLWGAMRNHLRLRGQEAPA